ncbi:cell division protein SepF [Eubacterium oxidoreducens]|uniref:Cell division protein SepF n=1 Tax=Eubacterium oxidoreducens TaxID=1732 RepID=A0A1G6ALJ8_EUBOX|nr:cell division protein SepF [Eubacterium oxidoreducens]SDB09276.1 cell division inhibitor SepF [Eubacterium oxidoreducens]
MAVSVLDKFLDVMKLNPEEEEDGFYDEYYDDEEEEVKPSRRNLRREKAASDDESYESSSYERKSRDREKASSKITPMRSSKKNGAMEVCVIKPNSFETVSEIVETLLVNRTVVLNLEGLNVDVAQRIIDFVSGATFAINGNLQKITNYIFIITPASVDVSGDFQTIVDSFNVNGKRSDY